MMDLVDMIPMVYEGAVGGQSGGYSKEAWSFRDSAAGRDSENLDNRNHGPDRPESSSPRLQEDFSHAII
jgi:hypothetical protein